MHSSSYTRVGQNPRKKEFHFQSENSTLSYLELQLMLQNNIVLYSAILLLLYSYTAFDEKKKNFFSRYIGVPHENRNKSLGPDFWDVGQKLCDSKKTASRIWIC